MVDANYPESFFDAKEIAKSIGFPVLLKCAHGGGGKAMRYVKSIENFENAWNTVALEAKKFFDSSTIIIEKQIEKPRHVEVQIAGDGRDYIHLYERECSIQRKHQKVIEEAPCNFVSKKTKERLYAAALKAAKIVNYQNIGTVEFLVTQNEEIYFLEMNTRLQVEHSVTEFVTGKDLVALQIYIAENKKLPYTQKEISIRGHAIESRIYSEDENFMPSTGKITNLVLPSGPFIRIDHDLEQGTEITHFFDPMLLKLTAYSQNRKIAIKKIVQALKETNFCGVKTNIEFLLKILNSHEFNSGKIHTQLECPLVPRTRSSRVISSEIVSRDNIEQLFDLLVQQNKKREQKA
jgi:acetyl/propionyl-CoA carboxylase alpha subunit